MLRFEKSTFRMEGAFLFSKLPSLHLYHISYQVWGLNTLIFQKIHSLTCELNTKLKYVSFKLNYLKVFNVKFNLNYYVTIFSQIDDLLTYLKLT